METSAALFGESLLFIGCQTGWHTPGFPLHLETLKIFINSLWPDPTNLPYLTPDNYLGKYDRIRFHQKPVPSVSSLKHQTDQQEGLQVMMMELYIFVLSI